MDIPLKHDEWPEAREQLSRLAQAWVEDSATALQAIQFLSGMRGALDEDDFRWSAITGPLVDRRKLRRERLLKYTRYRELFELEVRTAREAERAAMAERENWSGIGRHMWNGLNIGRGRAMLRLAALLYWLEIPGGLDLCDAGAFVMFRSTYFAA